MNLRNRVGLLVLAASVTLAFVGAAWPLNPLVTRTAQPAGPVPAECEGSLAPPAAPRVNVAEIPEREIVLPASTPPAPPPSRSLREELESAHTALAGNDRPAFDRHLRAVRELVAAYPPGAERSRAEEVLWALQDAAVLWDTQFESPFFDESSDAYTRASRYAGYADAVRRSVLTDDRDRRFYPAAESRDFVTRVAAERLQRLGIRSTATPPPRVARADRTPASTSVSTSTSTSASTSPSTSTSSSASRRVSPTPRRTTRSSSRRSSTPSIAKSSKPAAPAKSAPSSSPDPSAAASPAPAEPAPTAPSVSAPGASADAAASPVAETAPPPAVDEDPATPVATDSATTTSAPVAPTPEEPAAPGAVPAERRSIIVPALLIAIGLGVLVVLFRASK